MSVIILNLKRKQKQSRGGRKEKPALVMDREKLAGTGETCRRRAPATWKSLMSVAINAPTPPPRSTFWIEGEMENETTKKRKNDDDDDGDDDDDNWENERTHTHTHTKTQEKNRIKGSGCCSVFFVLFFCFFFTPRDSDRHVHFHPVTGFCFTGFIFSLVAHGTLLFESKSDHFF